MRIIGGQHRGRRLVAPSGRTTRPTTDRLRESIFNILTHKVDFEGARVLDVFAGTGALGLEALSRGAAHATFMERDAQAVQALSENIATLKVGDHTRVLRLDAMKLPTCAGQPFDLVFLDPPYQQDYLPRTLAGLVDHGWLTEDAVLITEQDHRETDLAESLNSTTAPLHIQERRTYGETRFTFLTRSEG